jgi:hypothetical protein
MPPRQTCQTCRQARDARGEVAEPAYPCPHCTRPSPARRLAVTAGVWGAALLGVAAASASFALFGCGLRNRRR